MPRIDPLSLLRCLSVLLGPNGGIKSKDEVGRLANLMTKFSKKLVSKCIYIQILKNTQPELLDQFMSAGGWKLIHTWLADGIQVKNWPLIQELLELLLLCPVDIERLKSNNCPKLVKGLSKEGSHEGVRTVANRLVEQWLKMVKGESVPSSAAVQAEATVPSTLSSSIYHSLHPNSVITANLSLSINSENAVAAVDSFVNENPSVVQSSSSPQQIIHSSPQIPALVNAIDKPENVKSNSSSSVYKITIRDGKQVLTQVQTDASNINGISVNNIKTEVTSDFVDNALPTEDQLHKSLDKNKETLEKLSIDNQSTVDGVSKDISSVVKENSLKTVHETDVKNKDVKAEGDDSSDVNKSTSDKENRDKKDDKKSVSTSSSIDKKSSHALSSNKSSSKHSSSSSKHSSSSHRSSSHRSNSKSSSNSSSRDKSSKERDKHYSSSSSKSSSNKSKSEREREKERERLKKDQAEKDKATLEKLQSQALSTKMGKIPKKKVDDEKSGDLNSRKSSTDSKDNKDKADSKKSIPEKKNISISIENRKAQDQSTRPKTVKTFNSKFRSTGLEEEVKPLSRGVKKPTPPSEKKVILPKIPLKRPSPIKESGPSDKKTKLSLDSPTTPPHDEKKGGIKLIPAKPKLIFLQESDMFMDALTASTKNKEPRKRKRRTSITKDGLPDSKKPEYENHRDANSPPSSPMSPTSEANKDTDEKSSPPKTGYKTRSNISMQFYQDTLETDEEKEDKHNEKSEDGSTKEMDVDEEDVKKVKRDVKEDEGEDEERSRTPTPENDFNDDANSDSSEDPAAAVSEAMKKEDGPMPEKPLGALKSVLLLQKRKGPKKSLKWKTELESIRYFELDETERVNVTKTFTDAKQMEKMNEREAFQMARKLSSEDVMEEKTLWKQLIPIDLPSPLVDPGKDSREKDIQYAREKGILQALYFNRSMIPDSSAEPDEERHHIYIEPKSIPLDDLTGNKDSEKDFTNVPWPEPKPQLPAPSTIMPNSYFPTFRPNQQPMVPPMGAQPSMNSVPQQIMNSIPHDISTNPPSTGGGGWRTGDGKIVVPDPTIAPINTMPANYAQGMEGGSGMVPPNMMGVPPMYNQDGYMMGPEEIGFNNFQGPPPGPGMFGPSGPPFQGPRGPPMHGNRGRGGPPGPGWFRGGPPRGMPWRGGWRGNNKPPVCRQFSKNGFCRIGDKCQYLHPGLNCPPF